MGGYGSGRWIGRDAKQTVEDCLTLNVDKLARDKLIRTIPWQGSLVWTNTRTREQIASVGYTCMPQGEDLVLTLIYSVKRGDDKHDVRLPVHLQKTIPGMGGVRWWFTCPLVKRGRECERRVGRLYLPPGGIYFGCRHCYDLTYTSCQESHKFDTCIRHLAAECGCTFEEMKRMWW